MLGKANYRPFSYSCLQVLDKPGMVPLLYRGDLVVLWVLLLVVMMTTMVEVAVALQHVAVVLVVVDVLLMSVVAP